MSNVFYDRFNFMAERTETDAGLAWENALVNACETDGLKEIPKELWLGMYFDETQWAILADIMEATENVGIILLDDKNRMVAQLAVENCFRTTELRQDIIPKILQYKDAVEVRILAFNGRRKKLNHYTLFDMAQTLSILGLDVFINDKAEFIDGEMYEVNEED